MKKNIFFSIVAIICTACYGKTDYHTEKQETATLSNINNMTMNVSPDDLTGIKNVLDLYVQAAIEGNSAVARPAFAEGATISHIANDSLICLPIQALFDYYDETGQHPASYEITECKVAGDAAMVSIESAFGDAKFTDMFALLKEGNKWKIVSKIFHVQ